MAPSASPYIMLYLGLSLSLLVVFETKKKSSLSPFSYDTDKLLNQKKADNHKGENK